MWTATTPSQPLMPNPQSDIRSEPRRSRTIRDRRSIGRSQPVDDLSADGVVVEAGRGLRLVSFEVDALTGTTLDGVERGAFVPTRNHDAPTIVACDHRAAAVDVAAAILEDK